MIRSWRLALVCATILSACGLVRPARADLAQTKTIPLTDTNWNSSTPGTDPLVFNQFNPSANPTQTLQEIDITVTFHETNTFSMTFTGPSTISVTAVDPADKILTPTISADTSAGWPLSSFVPSLAAQDTSKLTKTVTEGTGVSYPLTLNSAALGGPVSIAPTSQTTVLSPGSTDFNAFVGTGTLSFPFLSLGGSTFSSSTGNGGGAVTTQSGVTMTVDYITTSKQIVPEPSSVVLLGLGAAGLLVAHRWRSAAARQAGA